MCGRVEHYVAAAGHGAVASLFVTGALPVAAQASLSGPVRAVVAVLAAAGAVPMSGGKYSPDLDQFEVWRKWDRRLPDEWLGFGGPMAHRHLTHWCGLPAVATAALVWACQLVPLAAAVLLVVVAWVPLAGVWSHLLSDFVIGAKYDGGKRPDADDPFGGRDRKSMMDADDCPRGPGIPLLPWTLHVGLGYRVGSVQEWLWVFGSVAVGCLAVFGAWRGVSLPWSTPGALATLVGLLALGFAGRARHRPSAARRAANERGKASAA